MFTITLPLLFNVKMESVSMVSVCVKWQYKTKIHLCSYLISTLHAIMKCMKKIFGNNIILKLTFASLTAFLLFEEFYVFFIVKPTYTTSAKLQIGVMWKFCIPRLLACKLSMLQVLMTTLTSLCAHFPHTISQTFSIMVMDIALSMQRYQYFW